MHPNELRQRRVQLATRRAFLRDGLTGLGGVALASMMASGKTFAAPPASTTTATPGPLAPKQPHFAPKAKSVIYLHMSGAPPQHELFEWKPKLVELNMQPCPDEFMKNQRFPFIKGHPKLLGTPYKFAQHGQSGAWV